MENKGCLWLLFIAWWWEPLKLIYHLVIKALNTPTAPTTSSASAPTHAPAASRPSAPASAPAPAPKTEHHNVAGTSFHREALMALGVKNEDYSKTKRDLIEEECIGERIYQTDFYATKVELVPEPDNPHDPHAIKVVVDGQHIGYIKKGSCAHVANLIEKGLIAALRCEIKGGRYKVILEDEDVTEDGDVKTRYDLITDEHPLCADLYITLKE